MNGAMQVSSKIVQPIGRRSRQEQTPKQFDAIGTESIQIDTKSLSTSSRITHQQSISPTHNSSHCTTMNIYSPTNIRKSDLLVSLIDIICCVEYLAFI